MGCGWGGDGVGFCFGVEGGGLGIGYRRIVSWGTMHREWVKVVWQHVLAG